MIIVAELQMQGEKHVQVNSSFLSILNNTFPNIKKLLFCDNFHLAELQKNNICGEDVIFNSFKYTGAKEQKKTMILPKLLREVALAITIFFSAKRLKCERIFFLSASPFTSVFLNFFSFVFQQKILICLHGDLGVLTLKRDNYQLRIFRSILKFFFKFRSKYVAILFYGETIKTIFFRLYPNYNQKNVITIDHPYIYNKTNISFIDFKEVVIANIGVAIMTKNSHLIFELASKCKNFVEKGNLKFKQIGNVSEEVLTYSNEFVENQNINGFISTEKFNQNLNTANYFIYFFTADSYYDLCPSGTFFDAIKYCKPIISLRNPFFEYYFEKLGNIGYLCDSIDNMHQIITSIMNNQNMELYLVQVENLKRAQSLLSNNSISISFQEQLSLLN